MNGELCIHMQYLVYSDEPDMLTTCIEMPSLYYPTGFSMRVFLCKNG